ncbi:MAG TPA: hypothetical protein VI306_00655 [Pyrinomonadaceae bacterium]
MAQSDDGPKKESGRTSGEVRRIVVQDLPPEELPEVRGRKLATPADLDKSRSTSSPRNSRRVVSTSPTAPPPRLTVQDTYRPAAKPVARQKSEAVNVKRLLILLGAVVFVPALLVTIVLLLPKPKRKVPGGKLETIAFSAPSPVAGSPLVTPTPETSPSEPVAHDPNVSAQDVRTMTIQLASQISQKSGFEFSPEFIDLIRLRTVEYSDQKALSGARQYRREINKSFRDEGLFPLVGYALALSRSKFDPNMNDKGIGIWQLPLSVARSQGYLGANENGTKLKQPDTSAQFAASYTKQLLSAFDTEDFMYAIACFGMSLQDAGRLQGQLVRAAPDPKERRDIMNMIRAGVLNQNQVDNIARFFAAGIVGENPTKFGLNNSDSFSSLI